MKALVWTEIIEQKILCFSLQINFEAASAALIHMHLQNRVVVDAIQKLIVAPHTKKKETGFLREAESLGANH